LFTRKAGVWKLSTLELVGADTYADPLVQYCHRVGDVMPYRLRSTKFSREYAEKRLAKATAKAELASAEATKAQAAATASGKAGKVEAARLAAEKATKAQATAAQRKTEFEHASRLEATAIADAKAMEDARTAGVAALSGQAPAAP
jgi:hypothetical protein